LMGEYLPCGGTDEELHDISLVHFITSDFPPVFIMTCPGDFLKAQPGKVIGVLEEKDVEFVYRRYGNGANPLGHVFHCNIRLPEAKRCNDEECDFFKSFL